MYKGLCFYYKYETEWKQFVSRTIIQIHKFRNSVSFDTHVYISLQPIKHRRLKSSIFQASQVWKHSGYISEKKHSHISAFIHFVVSPTLSSSQNNTSNSNHDPRRLKSTLAGVPTQDSRSCASRREDFAGKPKGWQVPPFIRESSLGWRAASQAQETWPRRPVALQIIFPDLLWAFWFSAIRCNVNCHSQVSEQLSINSCRTQLTQAEHSKAGLLLVLLVMHRVGVKPKYLQPWNYSSDSKLNKPRTLHVIIHTQTDILTWVSATTFCQHLGKAKGSGQTKDRIL